jgi:hypothetical protein
MEKFNIIIMILLTGILSCSPANDNSELVEESQSIEVNISEEENAINETVKNVYACLSFEEDSAPNYEDFKAYFIPEATMYDYSGDSLAIFSIDDWTSDLKALVDEGQITSLKVIEGGGETEYFGKIANRISVNVDYFNESEEAEKGLNSIQLVKVNGRWLINSITWDVEKEGQPIPEKYDLK